jgi:hypothetical protein
MQERDMASRSLAVGLACLFVGLAACQKSIATRDKEVKDCERLEGTPSSPEDRHLIRCLVDRFNWEPAEAEQTSRTEMGYLLSRVALAERAREDSLVHQDSVQAAAVAEQERRADSSRQAVAAQRRAAAETKAALTRWVGFVSQKVYFRNQASCNPAQYIKDAVYFSTEGEATKAGYRHTDTPGC